MNRTVNQLLAEIDHAVTQLKGKRQFLDVSKTLELVQSQKAEIERLKQKLNSANHSKGQYKSMYESKSKQCLRLTEDIKRLTFKIAEFTFNEK